VDRLFFPMKVFFLFLGSLFLILCVVLGCRMCTGVRHIEITEMETNNSVFLLIWFLKESSDNPFLTQGEHSL